MRKISNRAEANDYYQIINKGVDEFITKTNATPTEVHRYLKNNKKRFLKKLDLQDVDGVESVLGDVISHRKHLQDDRIITFENFSKLNEHFVDLSNPSIEFEKVLADKFNTSLGHIELVDPQYHLYKINDFGNILYCMCFTNDDFKKIKDYLSNLISENVKNKVVRISSIDGVSVPQISLWLSEFIDRDTLYSSIESKIDQVFLVEFVFNSLNLNITSPSFKGVSTVDYFSDHFILSLV